MRSILGYMERADARRAVRLMAGTMAALAFTACSDGGSPSEPTPQSSLVVRNDALQAIQVVQFSECTADQWGPDRLGSTETIAPGATRTWTIAPGCWDLRVSTGTHAGYWYDNEVSAGGTLQFALPPVVDAMPAAMLETAKR